MEIRNWKVDSSPTLLQRPRAQLVHPHFRALCSREASRGQRAPSPSIASSLSFENTKGLKSFPSQASLALRGNGVGLQYVGVRFGSCRPPSLSPLQGRRKVVFKSFCKRRCEFRRLVLRVPPPAFAAPVRSRPGSCYIWWHDRHCCPQDLKTRVHTRLDGEGSEFGSRQRLHMCASKTSKLGSGEEREPASSELPDCIGVVGRKLSLTPDLEGGCLDLNWSWMKLKGPNPTRSK